jgi:hypothetical protein
MQMNLALIMLIFGCACAQFNPTPPLLGGISDVSDVDDESIRDSLIEIAQFGANRIGLKRVNNLTSSKPLNYTILRVISAKTQVVAGKIRLSFKILE